MVKLSRPYIAKEAMQSVSECLASGWIGYGPICRSLEERFTAVHQGWALATSSCTSALFLAAQLCRQSDQDEVICPAITFVSTPMAFLQAGWKVVLADVNADSLLITRQSIEEKLTDRTRAVIVVHLYGQKGPVQEIREFCNERNLILIEDCAHRLDLLDESPHLGDYACYSFNAVKEAPCGEGGVLWARDPEQRGRAQAISNVGLSVDTWQRSSSISHGDYTFTAELGLKNRLNDILASLVIHSLDELSPARNQRKKIFLNYDQGFSRLRSAAEPLVRGADDSYLMYILKLKGLDRAKFRAACAGKDVATSVHYPTLTSHPVFSGQRNCCPIADSASARIVTLPCHLTMTEAEQQLVVDAVTEAARQQAGD